MKFNFFSMIFSPLFIIKDADGMSLIQDWMGILCVLRNTHGNLYRRSFVM